MLLLLRTGDDRLGSCSVRGYDKDVTVAAFDNRVQDDFTTVGRPVVHELVVRSSGDLLRRPTCERHFPDVRSPTAIRVIGEPSSVPRNRQLLDLLVSECDLASLRHRCYATGGNLDRPDVGPW